MFDDRAKTLIPGDKGLQRDLLETSSLSRSQYFPPRPTLVAGNDCAPIYLNRYSSHLHLSLFLAGHYFRLN